MTKLLILQLLIVIIVYFIFIKSNVINSNSNFITQDQMTAHHAKAIVITCMDFRLIDDAVKYLDSIGYNNNYDEFILAGATLGYNQTKFTAWAETLDKHIELAENLHDIKEVIVIDHMQCGAYKIFYNKKEISREEEIELHKENFKIFAKTIGTKYPNLKVRTLLMDLDGKIIIV